MLRNAVNGSLGKRVDGLSAVRLILHRCIFHNFNSKLSFEILPH